MDQVEEIKEKVDIVEFVNSRVPLKRAGRNFKANCPFHQEKTPSFFVNPQRQIWYCFGACDEGGDIISFLQKWEGVDFSEALQILADQAGIKLERRRFTSEKTEKREKLYEINHLTAEYYHYLLTEHKVGEDARKYLIKRKIKGKTINIFNLGYAADSWDGLLRFLTKKRYSPQLIEESGLALKARSSRGYYDRFRGRLIFPILDHRGNIVGFSGRVFNKDSAKAKYINTPETLIYHKRKILYGLDKTAKAIRRERSAIIVEGEFDVLSSFQEGVSNIVAVKGSGLTDEQLKLLKRFTETIIFALDSDSAGQEAIKRGVILADDEGLEVKVIDLKDGKDPDEIIRKDPRIWIKLVKKPVEYFDFMIDSTISLYDISSSYNKRKIVKELAVFFARVANPIVRAHYSKKLAERLDMSESIIVQAIDQEQKIMQIPINRRKSITTAKPKAKKPRWQLLEEYILSLVMQATNPKKLTHAVDKLISFSDMPQSAASKILLEYSEYINKNKEASVADFIKDLDNQLQLVADRSYLFDLSAFPEDKLKIKEAKKAARDLKALVLREDLTRATLQLKKIEEGKETTDKDNKLAKLNKKISNISRQIHKLASAI